MGKKLSLSALISSLLATPLLAAPPARPEENQPVVNTAPAENQEAILSLDAAQFELQLRRLMNQQPLDAHGMQATQRQMAAAMNHHLEAVLLAERTLDRQPPFYTIQWTGGSPTLRSEKGAFLGVSTSPVTAPLRDQLHLTQGMGLVVDYVEKGSPAEAAGLQIHDVLQKLDDQVLVNPQQLAVLVRAKKPGDTLALALLRNGVATTVTAKLVEKDLPPLENLLEPGVFTNPGVTPIVPMPQGGTGPGQQQGALVIPDGATEQQNYSSRISVHTDADGTQTRTLSDNQWNITIRTTADGKSSVTAKSRDGQVNYSGTGQDAPPSPELAEKIAELQGVSNRVTIHDKPSGAGANHSASASRVDGDHEITVQDNNGERTLSVKDLHSGQMLFNGPFHGSEDLKGLPDGVVKKVNALLDKVDVPG